MKNTASAAPASKNIAPFEAGQVWKIGEVNIAVTQVGKTLVHFKRYKTKRPGNPTTMSSIRELQKYLLTQKAILASSLPAIPVVTPTKTRKRESAKQATADR